MSDPLNFPGGLPKETASGWPGWGLEQEDIVADYADDHRLAVDRLRTLLDLRHQAGSLRCLRFKSPKAWSARRSFAL